MVTEVVAVVAEVDLATAVAEAVPVVEAEVSAQSLSLAGRSILAACAIAHKCDTERSVILVLLFANFS